MHELAGKSLTVLGDSLSMSRIDDNLFAADLYPSRLAVKLGLLVFNRARRTNTTEVQCSWQNLYDDVKGSNSDYYVIQLGVCDCYPRIFTKLQHSLLAKLPERLRSIIIASRSRRRYSITKKHPYFNVNISDFERYYRKILAEIDAMEGKSREVIMINIAYPNQSGIDRNYNLLSIIQSYNSVIARLAETSGRYLIDLNTASRMQPEFILEDGIHISKSCHDWLAKEIEELLQDV